MIDFIKTTLSNNDPLILTIVFFAIVSIITTATSLIRTLLKEKKENSDKIYLLALILIAETLMTIITINTFIK